VPQCHHLVEDATEGPDITFLVIRLFLADFRREVIGRADGCLGAIISMLEDSSDAEIADFNLTALSHEDVLRLQVTMQDLAVMDVLNGEGHLDEPVEDLVLTVANSPDFLLIRNLSIKIAAICVVHHNAKTPLIHEGFLVGNDIRVPHGFENVHLVNCIFTLFAVHF